MAKHSINMITLMNTAWKRKQEVSRDDFIIKAKNLVTHSFVEYEKIFKDYCSRNGRSYNEEVFVCYQHIIVSLMMTDGEFLQGEYDTYCAFCKWAGFKALSPDDCRALDRRITSDQLVEDIRLLLNLRDGIDPENYEAMVQGFCYLSLTGDHEFDENEYYILRCFFEDGYDYSPSTWDQFKREW